MIILCSRAEMNEPYLQPLRSLLSLQVLRMRGRKLSWDDVAQDAEFVPNNVHEDRETYVAATTHMLGSQLKKSRQLRPVLSREQERLCGLMLDGKPRLVRGVAGSGKTVVMAHWLAQTVQRLADEPNVRIWAVFANRSLQSLIANAVKEAWDEATNGKVFPVNRIKLQHIREILEGLLPEVGLSSQTFKFEYDDAARAYLELMPAENVTARCDALFMDEAQDMGPNTLKLLTAIVRQNDKDDPNSRSVNVFYDNAQNIYRRGTPNWKEIGLGMRGRSVVMKESFRGTQPITEFALNVLYKLQPPDANPDHAELVSRGLIEETQRNGEPWWKVRFNQIDGPKPEFLRFKSLDEEFTAIADCCRDLILNQRVPPADICFIFIGSNIEHHLKKTVAPVLASLGAKLSIQKNKPFQTDNRVCIATSPNSFKGYDAEVVIIPAVDQYKSKATGVLCAELYVAMTRARSVLKLYSQNMGDPHSKQLYDVLEDCMANLEERPTVEAEESPQDEGIELLARVGDEHRAWLIDLGRRFQIRLEPLTTRSGQIVAEPLFVASNKDQTYACFDDQQPRQRVLRQLNQAGIKILRPGEDPDAAER